MKIYKISSMPILLILSVFLFANCASFMEGWNQAAEEQKAKESRFSTIKMPILNINQDNINPRDFSATIVSLKEWTKFNQALIGKRQIEELGGYDELYEWQEISYEPKTATFSISIKNNSQRILSYKGVVLTLNLNNSEIRSERTEIGNIDRCLPNDVVTINLTTPWNSELKAGDYIKILIYDIPAEINAVGNITKLENASFDFNVNSETLTYTSEGKRTYPYYK